MFNALKTPVIIGHRGASLHAPENTIAAFMLAIRQQADAIEFDVKLSSDQQVVVIHDPTVNRTTNAEGLVSRLSLAELKQLDAGSWFSPEFKREQIPTLEEVFDQLGSMIPMNIELTNYSTPRDSLVEKVVELIKKKGLERQIYLSSFFAANLRKAQSLLRGCGMGYLRFAGFSGLVQRFIQKPPSEIDSLNPASQMVTQGLIAREHSLGRRVLVYTVNDPEEMRDFFELGVDGVFTDDPAMGRNIALEYRN